MFAPNLLSQAIPSWQETYSYRNITIERSWRPVFKTWGQNVLTYHNSGLFGGVYQTGNAIHENLRKWVWFRVIQADLDLFVHQQNHHKIRVQPEKVLPSGGTSHEFYHFSQRYGGEQCGIEIDQGFIQQLLDDARSESGHLMEYVDLEFDTLAQQAYTSIGSPDLTPQLAWLIFEHMLRRLAPGDIEH
ncbi:hypothetical protein PQX77_021051 [Marasmius sp. AFHP31]|nr:hypothetical protein PQX77_021051 [Marasmius sp. AFHP31]